MILTYQQLCQKAQKKNFYSLEEYYNECCISKNKTFQDLSKQQHQQLKSQYQQYRKFDGINQKLYKKKLNAFRQEKFKDVLQIETFLYFIQNKKDQNIDCYTSLFNYLKQLTKKQQDNVITEYESVLINSFEQYVKNLVKYGIKPVLKPYDLYFRKLVHIEKIEKTKLLIDYVRKNQFDKKRVKQDLTKLYMPAYIKKEEDFQKLNSSEQEYYINLSKQLQLKEPPSKPTSKFFEIRDKKLKQFISKQQNLTQNQLINEIESQWIDLEEKEKEAYYLDYYEQLQVYSKQMNEYIQENWYHQDFVFPVEVGQKPTPPNTNNQNDWLLYGTYIQEWIFAQMQQAQEKQQYQKIISQQNKKQIAI